MQASCWPQPPDELGLSLILTPTPSQEATELILNYYPIYRGAILILFYEVTPLPTSKCHLTALAEISSPAWLGNCAEIADSTHAHHLSFGKTDMTKTHETGVYPKCHPVSPEELAVLRAAGLPPRPPLCSSALAPSLLRPRAEAGQLAETSGEVIVFQIQTWLPAQAQECQSQRKTEARTMRLGKEEEEEGGISPVAVHISAGCRGTSS